MNKLFSLISIAILISCSTPKQETKNESLSDEQLKIKANELAHKFIITDGHVDLPYRLRDFYNKGEQLPDISKRTNEGDFDYERAKKGGLDAPFMSIYIPARYQKTGGAKDLADSLINSVIKITEDHPDKFALANTPAEVEANFKKGLISLPMGMENGAPVEGNLNNLNYFQKRGIRYITLTHSKVNEICDSSYDEERTWNGLSDFGKDVIKRMNEVGIMIDVSHISDSTFYQVMELSEAPVIASHSSCRHYTPGLERNMSDDMIKLLGEKNGVIQINFGTFFIDGALDKMNDQSESKLDSILADQGLSVSDSAAQQIINEFRKANPKLYTTVEKVADHIDHVVNIAGIDHVGLGSDFDGVGDSLPHGLKDVSMYPNLIYELLKRGYSEEDIEKICYKNVWRVWNKVIDVAK